MDFAAKSQINCPRRVIRSCALELAGGYAWRQETLISPDLCPNRLSLMVTRSG